jgi:hypothetical protein
MVLLIVFTAVACKENPLDITPDGRLSLDDTFSESETTISYLNTTYGYIPRYGTNYFFNAMLAGITDNGYDADVVEGGAGVVAPSWYDGGLTPTNNPINAPGWNSYFYNNWWQGIRKANVFLANIDDATLSQEREAERPRLKAEAKVLRAYFYLELIKAHGGMPVIDEQLPPDFDYSTLERDSFEEVVQFIVQNCEEAIEEPSLPWRITDNNEAGRFTKAIAHAIKSEALLYNASPLWNSENDPSKWQAAAEASKEALDLLTSNGYELYPDYEEYFLRAADYNDNPSDKETIFEITGAMNQITEVNQLPTPGLPQFKAGTTPSQELVDAYDMQSTGEPAILGYEDENHLQPIINPSSGYDPENPYEDRDPRFYATVWYNGALFGDVGGMQSHELEIYDGGIEEIRASDRRYTNTGYYLRKFVDPQVRTVSGGQSTFKRFRLAEIYLNYAEAANEANGPTGEVYDAINTVRARVNMPALPTDLSQKEMRDRIRNERRVELAMEEHRFWDIRRWEILDQTGKLVTGLRWTNNGDGTFSGERFIVDEKESWEDRYLIFPIPLDEISKMEDFEQNPGW